MTKPDIFSELNDVLSAPRTNVDAGPGSNAARPAPDPMVAKRIGGKAAAFLKLCETVGPLAPPTRSRDHRFRAELSALFDPRLHGSTPGDVS